MKEFLCHQNMHGSDLSSAFLFPLFIKNVLVHCKKCCSVLGIHLINNILVHVNHEKPPELEAGPELPAVH